MFKSKILRTITAVLFAVLFAVTAPCYAETYNHSNTSEEVLNAMYWEYMAGEWLDAQDGHHVIVNKETVTLTRVVKVTDNESDLMIAFCSFDVYDDSAIVVKIVNGYLWCDAAENGIHRKYVKISG